MFRFSLVVCVSLILGITAKPHKPWNKLTDAAFQDTVVSIDDKGKMSWEEEVEPPEDLDETHYKINPGMMIWKSVAGNGQENIQAEAPREDASMREPEQDWDEVYHKAREELDVDLALLTAEHQARAEVRVAHSEPEEDEDDLYHRDHQSSPAQMELLIREVRGESEVRVHLQPEEDMDDLYDRDIFGLSQDAVEPDDPVDVWPQRRYSEPEEDLDDLYHQ